MNNLQHKTHESDHSMAYLNKRMEKETTTDVKSDESNQHFDSSDSSMAVGSVVSMNANYLSNSPPSYILADEHRRNGDMTGTLNSAFKVDRIDEEPEESDYIAEHKTEVNANTSHPQREIDA